MSQNQSYFWKTTRNNVYLKRAAKLQMLLALLAVLTFSTICAVEIDKDQIDANQALNVPMLDAPELKPNAIDNAAIGKTEKLPESDATSESKLNAGFIDAFTASISVILLTELGDKTFFIAAIMAMRHPRLIVFSGAISALALMTVLSVVFGMAATIIPYIYTYYISTALFAIFGIKMLYEGYRMKDSDAQEEMEEVQSDLRKREDELLRKRGRKGEEADGKRKNSNSDKEDSSNIGDVEAQALVHSNNIIVGTNNANNNNNNINNNEMQHRQRKQRSNVNNLIKSKNCDKTDADVNADDDDSHESEVFLAKDGSVVAHLKMPTYHSSPALSTSSVAVSQQTQETYCDSPLMIKSSSFKETASISGCKTSIISPSAAANNCLVHKSAFSKDDIDPSSGGRSDSGSPAGIGNGVNGSVSSIIEAAGTPPTLAGHLNNGELKQRLDRDVNAALVKDPESGVVRKNKKKGAAYLGTRIFVQAFTMTFLAEWGDRSQITTIILAASKDVFGVIVGGILGHSVCTGLAVIGGRIVAAKISVRTVTIVGGIVFIGFAVYSLLMPPEKF